MKPKSTDYGDHQVYCMALAKYWEAIAEDALARLMDVEEVTYDGTEYYWSYGDKVGG